MLQLKNAEEKAETLRKSREADNIVDAVDTVISNILKNKGNK